MTLLIKFELEVKNIGYNYILQAENKNSETSGFQFLSEIINNLHVDFFVSILFCIG